MSITATALLVHLPCRSCALRLSSQREAATSGHHNPTRTCRPVYTRGTLLSNIPQEIQSELDPIIATRANLKEMLDPDLTFA